MRFLLKIIFGITLICGGVAHAQEGGKTNQGDKDILNQSNVESEKPVLNSDKTNILEADLKNLEQEAWRYISQGHQYHKDVVSILEGEIARREKMIKQSYAKVASSIEDELRVRRLDAIKVFERYLQRYPNNRKYTPEVMFRLAELYYDDARDRYLLAGPQYEEQRRLYERGKIPEEPQEPVVDYSKSIKIYEELLARFPDYQLADTAAYALGYCLEQSGQPEKAVNVFRALIERYPNSQWIPEAWLRIGEFYFESGQYDDSIECYKKAMVSKESRYYWMALYKLAWSYFQKFDYPTAIETFKQLIELVDSGQAGSEQGKALREEAIEYLSIALTDDDWNGDGEVDKDATVDRALRYLSSGKPYEREILEKYADQLYGAHELKKYPMAIAAYRALIDRDPLNPGNAVIKEKIIGVYDALRDIEKMTAERIDMVRQFGPGSKWYEANKTRPEVLARVDRQTELALDQAARFHHKKAQDLMSQAKTSGDQNLQIAAIQEYKAAAEAYREYLRRFSDSKYAYENTFFYGECLFYSFEFENATRQYEKVRDWPNKTQYLEIAAFNAIDSLEKAAAKLVTEGKLAPSDVPGQIGSMEEEKISQTEGEGKIKIEPLQMPEITKWWIKAVDAYLSRGLSKPNDPDLPARLAFRAAAEFYKFRHFEEARKRFAEIIQKYPQHLVATYSAISIINTYRLENDWEQIAVWAKKIEELKLGRPEERAALHEEVKIFQLGAQFKEAEKLMEQEQYVKAAEEFLKVVDADPANKVADKALQNAAVCYLKAHHYDSAAKVYERLASDSLYKDSPFVEGAIFQLAESSRKFYDFEKAIGSYQALLRRFPETKERAYAMYSIALLQEMLGRLDEATNSYIRFVDSFPNDPEAGPALFHAGVLSEKYAPKEESLKIYQRFIKQFGGNPNQNEKVIEAMSRIADLYKALGRYKEWETALRLVVQEAEKRGIQPGTPASEFPARAQFLLTEEKLRIYEDIKFVGNQQQQKKALEQKSKMAAALSTEYQKVLQYKSPDWYAAAYFRLAYIYEKYAEALVTAELPQNLPQDIRDELQNQLEDRAMADRNAAIEGYRKTVEECRKLKITNEWTKKAAEALNKYFPNEFPLQKEDKQALDFEIKTIPQFEESL